jgi:hypothetical protein
MKKMFFVVLLAALTFAQTASKCSVCQKVPKCPQELFNDANVDPIFNFIAQQISPSEYPQEIKKDVSQVEVNYTFFWKSEAYLAVVDLKTSKFKVLAIQQPQAVIEAQNKLGLRETVDKNPVST